VWIIISILYLKINYNFMPLRQKGKSTMKQTITLQQTSEMTAVGNCTNGNRKPVFCLTTGEVYASVRDAAKIIGSAQSCMSRACSDSSYTCKGKRFCFVSDIVQHLDEMAENIRKAKEYDKLVAQKKPEARKIDEAPKANEEPKATPLHLKSEDEMLMQLKLLLNNNYAVAISKRNDSSIYSVAYSKMEVKANG
jgi:hypothetical protein